MEIQNYHARKNQYEKSYNKLKVVINSDHTDVPGS